MSGALNFANNTWNNIGDDVAIGDHNVAGGLGIRGLNGNTRLDFVAQNGTSSKSIVYDGTNLTMDGNAKSAFSGITDSITSTASNVAASAAAVKTLNDKITQTNSNIIDAGIIFSSADNLDDVYYNSFLIKNLVAFRLHFSISGTLEVNTWYKIGSVDKHFPNGAYPLLITCPQTNAWIAYPIAARIDRSGNLWIAVKEKMWNATVILSGIWFVS